MDIEPVAQAGDHLTGHVDSAYTVREITKILGFAPNVQDDPSKVRHSWGFIADGKRCGVWDYKGRRWSFFGPTDVLDALFPKKVR